IEGASHWQYASSVSGRRPGWPKRAGTPRHRHSGSVPWRRSAESLPKNPAQVWRMWAFPRKRFLHFKENAMNPAWLSWSVVPRALIVGAVLAPFGNAACCYFSAKDKDMLQPSQKVFITWDPERRVETFTVQPKFEGNARDFGMVIPTPSQPTLHEMPRDFFRE